MNEKQLENALYTWPLAEVPDGFSTQVMEKIVPRQSLVGISQKSRLKFRLTWMDLALGTFLSLLPVLAFIALNSLPRKFVLYMQYQWLLLRFPGNETVLIAFTGMVAMLLLLAIVFSLRFIFPRQVSLF